jgi:NOL1/NOP2/fmu family ribosome biogenesis protein
VLIANEIHPKRVWDLAENLERCGVTHTAILNETPQRLANHFGPIFDYVLVDAPCSGEGMFRKSQSAIKAWSPELVRGCANRQKDILDHAAELIRPGGYILYSTCTFSTDENEMVLGTFLETMKQRGEHFEIKDIPQSDGFQPAISRGLEFPTPVRDQVSRAVRLWPHQRGPEGHFMALIQRLTGKVREMERKQNDSLPENTWSLFSKFCQENLNVDLPADRLHLSGNYVYFLPDGLPDLSGLKVIHPGWWLGSIKTKRFAPSHALALGLKPEHIKNIDVFPPGSSIIESYLRGETLRQQGPDGWTALAVDIPDVEMFVFGWGRRIQDIIKNFYPRGLRWV